MAKRELSKCRVWERERRDRLKNCFNALGKLLPCYDPSSTLSKIEILQKSAALIVELQNRNKELLSGGSEASDAQKNEIVKLQDRIKKLLVRNEQLANLLQTAGIKAPSDCGTVKNFNNKKFSCKITPEIAENLVKRFSKNGIKKQGKNEKAKTRAIPKKKKKIETPNENIDLNNKQKNKKKKSKPPTTTVLTSPLGPGTLIFADGRVLPIPQQPITRAPPPIALPRPLVPPIITQTIQPKLLTTTRPLLASTLTTPSLTRPLVATPIVATPTQTRPTTVILMRQRPVACKSKVPIPPLKKQTETKVTKKEENAALKKKNVTVKKKLVKKVPKKVTKSPLKSEIIPDDNKSEAISISSLAKLQESVNKIDATLNDVPVQQKPILNKDQSVNDSANIKNKEKPNDDTKNEVPTTNVTSCNNKKVDPVDESPKKHDESPKIQVHKIENIDTKTHELEKKDKSIEDDSSKTDPAEAPKSDEKGDRSLTESVEASVKVVDKLQSVEKLGKDKAFGENIDAPKEKVDTKSVSGDKNVNKIGETSSGTDCDKSETKSSSELDKINTKAFELSLITFSNITNLDKNIAEQVGSSIGVFENSKADTEVANISEHHSELSNDIFATLSGAQPNSGHPESMSPTAAFLLAFPLVSTLTGTTSAPKTGNEITNEDNSDSRQDTPTILQIGTLENNGSAKPSSDSTFIGLENFTTFFGQGSAGNNCFEDKSDKKEAKSTSDVLWSYDKSKEAKQTYQFNTFNPFSDNPPEKINVFPNCGYDYNFQDGSCSKNQKNTFYPEKRVQLCENYVNPDKRAQVCENLDKTNPNTFYPEKRVQLCENLDKTNSNLDKKVSNRAPVNWMTTPDTKHHTEQNLPPFEFGAIFGNTHNWDTYKNEEENNRWSWSPGKLLPPLIGQGDHQSTFPIGSSELPSLPNLSDIVQNTYSTTHLDYNIPKTTESKPPQLAPDPKENPPKKNEKKDDTSKSFLLDQTVSKANTSTTYSLEYPSIPKSIENKVYHENQVTKLDYYVPKSVETSQMTYTSFSLGYPNTKITDSTKTLETFQTGALSTKTSTYQTPASKSVTKDQTISDNSKNIQSQSRLKKLEGQTGNLNTPKAITNVMEASTFGHVDYPKLLPNSKPMEQNSVKAAKIDTLGNQMFHLEPNVSKDLQMESLPKSDSEIFKYQAKMDTPSNVTKSSPNKMDIQFGNTSELFQMEPNVPKSGGFYQATSSVSNTIFDTTLNQSKSSINCSNSKISSKADIKCTYTMSNISVGQSKPYSSSYSIGNISAPKNDSKSYSFGHTSHVNLSMSHMTVPTALPTDHKSKETKNYPLGHMDHNVPIRNTTNVNRYNVSKVQNGTIDQRKGPEITNSSLGIRYSEQKVSQNVGIQRKGPDIPSSGARVVQSSPQSTDQRKGPMVVPNSSIGYIDSPKVTQMGLPEHETNKNVSNIHGTQKMYLEQPHSNQLYQNDPSRSLPQKVDKSPKKYPQMETKTYQTNQMESFPKMEAQKMYPNQLEPKTNTFPPKKESLKVYPQLDKKNQPKRFQMDAFNQNKTNFTQNVDTKVYQLDQSVPKTYIQLDAPNFETKPSTFVQKDLNKAYTQLDTFEANRGPNLQMGQMETSGNGSKMWDSNFTDVSKSYSIYQDYPISKNSDFGYGKHFPIITHSELPQTNISTTGVAPPFPPPIQSGNVSNNPFRHPETRNAEPTTTISLENSNLYSIGTMPTTLPLGEHGLPVPTTLPTLIGDLALGNSTGVEDNRRGSTTRRKSVQNVIGTQNYDMNNTFSVSHLMEQQKEEGRTQKRNHGGNKSSVPNRQKRKECYRQNQKWDAKRFKNTNSTNYSAEALIGDRFQQQPPQFTNFHSTDQSNQQTYFQQQDPSYPTFGSYPGFYGEEYQEKEQRKPGQCQKKTRSKSRHHTPEIVPPYVDLSFLSMPAAISSPMLGEGEFNATTTSFPTPAAPLYYGRHYGPNSPTTNVSGQLTSFNLSAIFPEIGGKASYGNSGKNTTQSSSATTYIPSSFPNS